MADESEQANKIEEVKQNQEIEGPSSQDLIDKANAAAERLEAANAQLEKNLVRQEKLVVEARLGGNADASQPKKSDEEEAKEAAMKLMEGSGLNPFAKHSER